MDEEKNAYQELEETAWEYVDEYLDELEEDGKFEEDDPDTDGSAIY